MGQERLLRLELEEIIGTLVIQHGLGQINVSVCPRVFPWPHTVLYSDEFIYQALVRELSEEGSDHINMTIEDN